MTASALEFRTTRWLVLAVVSAAQFLTILDLWVVNIALPALQRDFAPAPLSDVAWILSLYSIVLAALLIPAGRLADSLGRRTLFMAGLALFGIASLGSALAPSLPILIAWRGAQAIAAAVLMPTSLSLALPSFPEHERGTAVGIWAAVAAVAAGLGPVLGGVLVEFSWRWIFMINVPIVLTTFAMGSVLLPRDRPGGSVRIDVLGTLLVLAATGLVCTALIEVSAWPGGAVWPALGVGLLLGAGFVWHVGRHPAPVLDPRLFAIREFRASAIGLVAYYLGFGAMLLAITWLLTEHWSLSVLQTALEIAPGPIAAGAFALVSGRVVARIGVRRTVMCGGLCFGAAAGWLLWRAGDVPAYATVVLPSLMLWATANALIQPTLFRAADAVPRAELTSGSAVLTVARQFGAALGVALFVALSPSGPIGLAALQHAWILVIASATATAAAGLYVRHS